MRSVGVRRLTGYLLFSTRLRLSCPTPLFKYDEWRSKYQSTSLLRETRHREGYIDQKEKEKELRVEFLSKTLQCSTDDALRFLDHSPRILSTPRSKFDKFIHLFLEHKIPTNEIFTYPDIFDKNYDTIRTRFLQLKDELDMAPVKLSFVNSSLPRYTKRLTRHLKERDAMSHMDSSLREAIVLLHNDKYLRRIKLSILRQKLELFITLGVPTEVILEKNYILAEPLEQLKTRSKVLQEKGILYANCPLKSYFFLFSCQDDSFARNCKKCREEIDLLGDSKSRRQFLQRQLHCDDRQIATMLKTYPKLLSVGAAKLNSTLHFLRKECFFTSEEIIANANLFRLSTDTLKHRKDELENLSYEVVTAKVLRSDGRVYKKIVDRLNLRLV